MVFIDFIKNVLDKMNPLINDGGIDLCDDVHYIGH